MTWKKQTKTKKLAAKTLKFNPCKITGNIYLPSSAFKRRNFAMKLVFRLPDCQ